MLFFEFKKKAESMCVKGGAEAPGTEGRGAGVSEPKQVGVRGFKLGGGCITLGLHPSVSLTHTHTHTHTYAIMAFDLQLKPK